MQAFVKEYLLKHYERMSAADQRIADFIYSEKSNYIHNSTVKRELNLGLPEIAGFVRRNMPGFKLVRTGNGHAIRKRNNYQMVAKLPCGLDPLEWPECGHGPHCYLSDHCPAAIRMNQRTGRALSRVVTCTNGHSRVRY